MKTHKVIDFFYNEKEGNVSFIGSRKECLNWVNEQGFGHEIVPMTKEELEFENK